MKRNAFHLQNLICLLLKNIANEEIIIFNFNFLHPLGSNITNVSESPKDKNKVF